MPRETYLELAAKGLRMPIGTDLVLDEIGNKDDLLLDGQRLGVAVEEAARRYKSPLALPLMDLTVEKAALCEPIGVSAEESLTFHFHGSIEPGAGEAVRMRVGGTPTARMAANADSIRYVASKPELLALGMVIGPFSLMTKLLEDPITPVYLAGSGLSAAEEPEVETVEEALDLALEVIEWSIDVQVEAGARAVLICEPAANVAYISPNQLEAGSDIFERYVLEPNRRLKATIERRGADFLFHDCGELTNQMVESFGAMRPLMLSLGASRVLWEDAALVPKDVVLYGNMPTKRFYSDDLVTVEQSRELACETVRRMKSTGHPHVLGSECDVLAVEGATEGIREKVQAFLEADCGD
jgi:uroporphyrinogen-III decarboxylase